MRRLRPGEWVAGIGAAGLLATSFLPWFGIGPSGEVVQSEFGGGGILNLLNTYTATSSSPWDWLGWLTLIVGVLVFASGAWLFIATAAGRPVVQQVVAGVLTSTIGTLGFVFLALRVLVFQPGSNELTTVRYGAYLGLLAAALVAIGGWWSLKDERTDAPESAYTPPAPRPAPPAHS